MYSNANANDSGQLRQERHVDSRSLPRLRHPQPRFVKRVAMPLLTELESSARGPFSINLAVLTYLGPFAAPSMHAMNLALPALRALKACWRAAFLLMFDACQIWRSFSC